MTVTTMTIDRLCLSPWNVRINAQDANAVEGMAESLLRVGQLYPLAVHSMPRGKGRPKAGAQPMFGVLAGGRRLRAFQRLIGEGRLPADHPIEVVVREIADEGALTELSLAENLVRVELRPYEVYAAVHRAHVRGRSFAEIARTNGQTVEAVTRWARLGALAPAIFSALEREEITQDQARAFAATEDQALQLWAWEQFTALPHGHPGRQPAGIRRMLKVGDGEQRKLLRFVGPLAYRAAGGRFERDLFADDAEERGRVVDEGLLMQLVEDRLAAARTRLRAQLAAASPGRTLRFEADYPRDAGLGTVALDLEIRPVWQMSGEDHARRQDLHEELAALEHSTLTEDEQQAIWQRGMDVLEAIDLRGTLTLPQAQSDADIFATLVIEPDGTLETRFWWASRKAMEAARKAAGAPARTVSAGPVRKPADVPARAPAVTGAAALARGTDQHVRIAADAAIRETHELTHEGIQTLRAMRRMVLRAALVADAWHDEGSGVGQDYLLWAMARSRFAPGFSLQEVGRRAEQAHERGIGGLYPADSEAIPQRAAELADATIAGRQWRRAVECLRAHESITQADPVAAFRAWRCEDAEWKDWAVAIVAGDVLARSLNADGYRVPLHDEIARQCGMASDEAVRSLIEPDEAFVELLPRSQRLALAQPHVDAATFRAWQKAKAADLVAPVTRALRMARAFVHPMIRFTPPDPAPPDSEPMEQADREMAA